MPRRSPPKTTAARATPESSPGRRQRAPPRSPPPAPRAADSCSDETSFLELEEDLAAEAVPERQVDERQRRHQERERQRCDRQDEKQDRGDAQEDSTQSLREVVGFRPVLDRSRLDDAGRLQDLEVELLEQRQLRHEGAEQQHDAEKRDQREKSRR